MARKNYLKETRKIPPFYQTEDWVKPAFVKVETLPIDIEGIAPGKYFANNIGEVYNDKGQKIKPNLINSGYYTYRLITGTKPPNGPKYKHILAHRLFMDTFYPPNDEEKKLTINHKNMNPADNKLSNLERVSNKENNKLKQENLLLDGTNIHNSFLSLNELSVVIKELDKGTKYSEILNIIGKENTKVNRDYIGNIKRGITYKRQVKLLRGKGFND